MDCLKCGTEVIEVDPLLKCTKCNARYVEFLGKLREVNVEFDDIEPEKKDEEDDKDFIFNK